MIAGTGPLEEELKLLTQKLSIEKNVVFTGWFGDEDKVKIYSAFDAFIFPSYTEGFGIVLIEAMYLGLPTIASDIEVLREVGKGAVRYFRVGSSSDLAEKIQKLYEDISMEDNFNVDKIVRKAETEYTMTNFVSNYLNLYKSSI
jgi:glycosyltransferase involved in cell wall biosynthesis